MNEYVYQQMHFGVYDCFIHTVPTNIYLSNTPENARMYSLMIQIYVKTLKTL